MPSFADLPDYLQPSFNPAAASKPRLRSILLDCDVTYSTSATKANLVGLFNQHVKPRIPVLIDAALSVRPTTRGIRDAETGNQREERKQREQRERLESRATTKTEMARGSLAIETAEDGVEDWAEARDDIGVDVEMVQLPVCQNGAKASPSPPPPTGPSPTPSMRSAVTLPPRLVQGLGSLSGMAQYMKQLKAEVTRLNARLDTNDDKIEQLQADNQNIRAHLEAVEKAIAMLE